MRRVEAPSRIKVGDIVQIIHHGSNFDKRHVGEICVVERDDGSDIPFLVKLKDANRIWVPEKCVIKVTDGLRHYDGKPVTAFEAGKWYQWVGPKERQPGWAFNGGMDGVLDGKPHQCTFAQGGVGCAFDIAPRNGSSNGWHWGGDIEHFREVPTPMSKSELVENIELFEKGFVPRVFSDPPSQGHFHTVDASGTSGTPRIGRSQLSDVLSIKVPDRALGSLRAFTNGYLGTPYSARDFIKDHCDPRRQISTRATIRKRLLNIE